MKLIATILSTVFLLTACGESGSLFQKPSVSYKSAQLQDVRATDATAVFNLQIENPNPFGLSVKAVNYQLAFNNRPTAINGKLDSGITIPAAGSAPLVLPISFRYADLVISIADIIRDKGAQYTLQGTIDTGYFMLPYSTTGKLTY